MGLVCGQLLILFHHGFGGKNECVVNFKKKQVYFLYHKLILMPELLYRNHFLNLFSVAIADNNIDPKELDYLYNLGLARGFDKEEIDDVIANPHKIRFVKPTTLLEAIEQLYELIGMLLSDEIIHPHEVDLCKAFAKKMDFKEEIIDELIEKLIEETRAGVLKTELIDNIKKSL
jgi:hypothetical protein